MSSYVAPMSNLADFVLLGQDAMGSYAMADVKSDMFGVVIDAFVGLLLEIINRFAVPRLFALNGIKGIELPRITASSAGRVDLEKTGKFLNEIAMSGAQLPWKQILGPLLGEAGLPTAVEDESLEEVRKAELAKTAEAEQREREAEEERERTALRAAIEPAGAVGSAFAVGPALATHASMMVLQLEREILSALSMLGAVAATAYLAVAVSQPKTGRARRGLANRTIKRMGLATWLHETLEPLLRNHASRVTADTKSLIEQQTGEQVEIPDIVVQRMGREAARYLRVRSNLEPQVKDAIIKAIEEGIEGGDDVAATAKRIEALVSAGRFTHGGARRRAQMLARDQTANMQRAASLAAYESMDSIAAIRLKDGIYGPPRSDQACIHRDGEIVPIEDAGSVQPLHPLCTLGFEPVVSNVSTELGRELGVA